MRRQRSRTGLRSMSILASVALGALCVAGVLSPRGPSVAQAFPQPSVYPTSWELDFSSDMPRRIVVQIPGQPSPKAYWYVTYVATNNTGQEQVFLPKFEMLTKDGTIVRSDRESSSAVFEAIARKESRKPLQPALKLQGKILVGEDQAKYGVAIWEQPMAEMGSFSIFVTGLSGETAQLTDDSNKPIMGADGQPIILRKTKELDFTVRGDELYAGDPIIKTGESWVMR